MIPFCLFLAIAASLATGQLFGLIPLLPKLKQNFGDAAMMGLPLFAAGYATGMVILGALSGRVGARRMLAGSLGGGALLSVACAWAPNVEVFLILRFAEAVALGGFPPAAFIATAQRVQPAQRLLPNSAMVFGLLGSAGLAGLASRFMAEAIGWRGALMAYGGLLMMVSILASRLGQLHPAQPEMPHPYRLIPKEAFTREGLFSGICGAFTMAAFVTTNALAQRSEHATSALVVVICAVLVVLGAAKEIVKRPPDARRATGLFLVCCGVWLRMWWPDGLVYALAIITVGATLVVPACIQQVIANAHISVPAAVGSFTCMLFLGGALFELAMTGIVPVPPTTITSLLAIGLGTLALLAWLRLRGHLWSSSGAM